MTNIPITAAQISAMVADRSQTLLTTLGLRIKEPQPDADPRRSRGIKREVFLGKSWGRRCKGWRHGAKKKKDEAGNLLYAHEFNPITARWDQDPKFRASCTEESIKEFGPECEFTREMALQADQLGREEDELSAARAKEHAMPSYQRQQHYPLQPVVRSQQAGGSNTRPRAGTEDERRAIAALRGRGRGYSSGGKGRGKSSTHQV